MEIAAGEIKLGDIGAYQASPASGGPFPVVLVVHEALRGPVPAAEEKVVQQAVDFAD